VTAVVLFLVVFFGVPLACWLGVRAARSRRPLPDG
jgi:hypothetical protein